MPGQCAAGEVHNVLRDYWHCMGEVDFSKQIQIQMLDLAQQEIIIANKTALMVDVGKEELASANRNMYGKYCNKGSGGR